LSYIIDVYRGTVKCEKSFYNYLTYTTLFPQIIAGPIVRYETVDEELETKNISMDNFSKGMRRFIIGLGKKILPKEAISQKRGGKGLICYKTSDATGPVSAAAMISDEDTVLLIGDKTSICIAATDIPALGRASSGNQMIKNGKVIAVSKV
jgi:DNA gyrase/topoisomerase IV subunit A